jgi:hypothetical protein
MNDVYLIKGETLTGIANSVRTLTGSNESFTPLQMINTIQNNQSKNIPKIYIDGEIPSNKIEYKAEMLYVSDNEEFHAYITIKW